MVSSSLSASKATLALNYELWFFPLFFMSYSPFLVFVILGAGCDLNYLSSSWGPPHAKVGTTMDIYSHVMPTLQKEAVKGFDLALETAASGPQFG